MNPEEQILVVPASALNDLGLFVGFRADDGDYVRNLLSRGDLSFKPRGAMEQDPSFKQLIPYVILECEVEGCRHLYCYTRGSGQGERRLHAKKSIGIGGHIAHEDAATDDPYRTGMRRELEEEVQITTTWEEELLGLIYDPSTEVGSVHLGIVHRFRLAAPHVRPREADLLDAGFRPLSELLDERSAFESWSQLALDGLCSVAVK
jgi:predicted NUDIX family phosphoesterase